MIQSGLLIIKLMKIQQSSSLRKLVEDP